ncbi:VOC family protein [Deinococcus sp. KNUC1210]|uniref:VOC family protein n=1 Tax=Deinococcus sp. KNUC1210 TaxID=2917691 RepID=UPI00351D2269
MIQPALDHLVFATADLASGQAALEQRLGVPLQPGGQHQYFGTHNAVLNLGPLYLEVIAVDPAAPALPRPRWFELDTPKRSSALPAAPSSFTGSAVFPIWKRRCETARKTTVPRWRCHAGRAAGC